MAVKVIIIGILAAAAGFVFLIVRKNKGKGRISWMRFYEKGKEAGFSNANIKLLKELARHSDMDHPAALFWSQVQMDDCIKKFIHDIQQKKTEFLPGNQEFLARLYDFRKKMELDRPIYKNGITNSRNIEELQTVQVVVANAGVFKSKIVNNKPASISIERPDSSTLPLNFKWKQKNLLVYFWRKSDAGYCFETKVINEQFSADPPILMLSHSDKLIRTQSRRSLRVKTHRAAMLYRIEDRTDSSKPELMPGIKCYLEDISDSGCAITVGGTTPAGLRVIVQFVIDKMPLSISGVVRSVEYNETKKTSMLHIESDLIPMNVKNKIFSVMFGIVVDDIDIISIDSGDAARSDKKAQTETPEDDRGETSEGNQINENKHIFDYHDSNVGDEIDAETEEYDDRNIADTIDWEKQSKTEDEGN
ncbi:MAG: PilZ domain-containing protein [Spirochaetaceae bacterium]|jgi:c-di-GMP-binding flagellar brake protein YcgR|nr:PilZ domain-containing protein [Spirochaetaceae bacterium]